MNIRDKHHKLSLLNKVLIKNTGPVYENVLGNDNYEFPKDIMDNILDIRIPYISKIYKYSGTITHIFEHDKGHKIYICRMDTGPATGKYIVIGRSGFKKKGTLQLPLSNFKKKDIV